MKNPIITDNFCSNIFCGGLGNILFQAAATLSFAKENNLNPVFGYWKSFESEKSSSRNNGKNMHFYPWGGHVLKNHGISLGDVYDKLLWFSGSPRIDDFTEANPSLLNADEYISLWLLSSERLQVYALCLETAEYIPWADVVKPPFVVAGYFMDHRYWHHNRDHLVEKFTLNTALQKYIQDRYAYLYLKETTSLHFRFGGGPVDFMDFIIPPTSWYKDVLSKIASDAHILVFSDNIQRAQNFLDIELNLSPIQYTIIDEDPYIVIEMIARCDNHILANSTLSFWGAYLDVKQNNPHTYLHHTFFNNHIKTMIPYDNWEVS